MPIEIVVNGYFRSGTTFIWNFLNETFEREGILSFYEPLNPYLALYIRKEDQGQKNRLHGDFLYRSYSNIENELLLKILRNNPNVSHHGIYNDRVLIDYLDIFNNMPQKIFLQPNRLNFHLDLLFGRYTKKIAHVIRHPLDVWLSVKKAIYSSSEDQVIRIIHRILPLFMFKNSFEIVKQYHWIYNHLGYPYNLRDSLYQSTSNYFNTFEKFVVVWTISNYFALKAINNNGGYLLAYEYLIDYPHVVKKELSQFLGMDLVTFPRVKKQNYRKFDKADKIRFLNTLTKYKLVDEFNYITEQSRLKEIWDL